MSDHVPGWMPSDETLRATAHNCTLYATCNRQDPMEDLRDVIEEAVEKALAEPRPEAPLNQRLYDLVRYQRHALHDSGLLTDEEFASLVLSGASSARRLEDYDKVRRRLAEQEARHRREVIEARIEELENYGYCGCPDPPGTCPTCSRVDDLRSETSRLNGDMHEP